MGHRRDVGDIGDDTIFGEKNVSLKPPAEEEETPMTDL
jgi:ABC-type transporter Mla subunit MlaD